MTVGIDVRCLAASPYTGVARTALALLPALFQRAPKDRFILFFVSAKAAPNVMYSWQQEFSHVTLHARRIPGRFFDAATRFVPQILPDAAQNCDILLSPNIHIIATSTLRVLVVHDLSFVRFSEFLTPAQRYWHWLMQPKKQAQEAAAIIVPSFATKQDLVKLWHIDEAKIRVIPWGTTEIRDQQSAIRNQDNPHVLSIGAVEPRKNFVTLVRAFELLKNKKARLLIVGPPAQGMNELQNAVVRSPAKARIEIKGFISEEEKQALLQSAAVFIYPSLLEGFGLPALEAMAQSVPVVASNRSSLPEVVGDAGILIDPHKPEEIAAAIDAILSDAELADELSRRGRERAQHFSWEKTANAVLEVLRSAAYR